MCVYLFAGLKTNRCIPILVLSSPQLDLLKPYVDNFAHWVTTMALLFIALAGVLEKQPAAGMTPMNGVLGVLNLIFLLDSIFRVTALRWEIFTFRRFLDLVDAIMIWISVIGYISWLQGGLPVMTMRILTFMHAITGFKAMGFFEKFVKYLEKYRCMAMPPPLSLSRASFEISIK
jgi:hypothetical protein